MSRKDSKGLFANVLGQLNEPPKPADATAPKPTTSPHLMKVAAGVRQIQERGEIAERLLKDGSHVVELDPAAILPSAIADRFDGAYDAASITELVESMRERGQIVPGLVRPVKGEPSRYQIVYGRRRLAAAQALGLKFRAVIRTLSDEEAVILQGEENTARNDLSFIEKCSFARTLEREGYSRATISASLSTGKSHISEMIGIAATLPERLVHAIGPAPDVGRRRWLQLVEKWRGLPQSHGTVQEILETVGQTIASNERFELALKSLFSKASHPEPAAPGPTEVVSFGAKLADVTYAEAGCRISFPKTVPADFVAYIAAHLQELHGDFIKASSGARTKNNS
jgi:ParB family chromosome partitioning protein